MLTPHLRLGFDARLAGSAHAGIGRYAAELLQRLVAIRQLGQRPITWVVWVQTDYDLPWLSERAASGAIELHPVDVPHYGVAEQTWWARELNSAQLDLLHVPHFNVPLLYRRPFVVTIHDLLWHNQRDPQATTLPAWLYHWKHAAYTLVSESAIKRAAAVLVPSVWVKQEVQRIVGRTSQVTVTYEGIPALYRQTSLAKVRTEPYMVYTGSLYPHKNLEVVLQALRELPTFTLRLASTRNVFAQRLTERARALGVADQVVFLGYVPDEQLIKLYQRARALLQPSKAEGFGLTGLEAMAVGCPVIAADIPVFREIYGRHAHFFAPNDAAALVQAVRRSPPPATSLRSAQAHARSFSWDKMTEQTLNVYQELLARQGKL